MVVIGVGGGQIRERSGDGGDGPVVDQGDLGGVERRAVVADVGLPRLLALRSGEGVPDGDEVPMRCRADAEACETTGVSTARARSSAKRRGSVLSHAARRS